MMAGCGRLFFIREQKAFLFQTLYHTVKRGLIRRAQRVQMDAAG